MRFYFHLRRGLFAASTALAALPVAQLAEGQYAPYVQPPQAQYATPGAYQQTPAQIQVAQQYAPQASVAPTGYPQGQPYAAAQTPPSAMYATPRIAMAYQNPAPSVENVPLTPGADVAPAGIAPDGGYPSSAAPIAGDYGQPMPDQGEPAAQSTNPYLQAASTPYESLGGCDNTGANCGYSTYGGGGHFHNMFHGYGARGCGYWFGGVYGLLMDRDSSNKYPLVFAAPTLPAGTYPAAGQSVALTTRNVDLDYQAGVEVRAGRTFGCATLDPCGCNTSCGPRWGLEGVYWQIFEDDETATYVDQGTLRTYSMMPMYGLEYDNGSGYRPINEYWDYAPPSQTSTDIEIRLARVRSSFEVQNFEVNLLRLSLCGGDYGCATPAVCNVGCDSGSCSNDACAGGACGTPRYGVTGSRYSCTGVCGVRFMQFDESFMYGVDFDNTGGGFPDPVDGSLNYWSEVENSLIGAQLGCNGMYRIGCKWGVHMNTLVGLYGNDIDVRQYMVSPTGLVRYIGTGEDFDVTANKTDVAMLGELRLGASYQATCKLRLYAGWRLIGVTGIALATDQTPNAFLSAAQMNNYVNSNGSMILHGLQTGLEFNY